MNGFTIAGISIVSLYVVPSMVILLILACIEISIWWDRGGREVFKEKKESICEFFSRKTDWSQEEAIKQLNNTVQNLSRNVATLSLETDFLRREIKNNRMSFSILYSRESGKETKLECGNGYQLEKIQELLSKDSTERAVV